jgi:hypothetical protein
MGNSEVDPQGGWNKPLLWRGDASYPAAVSRILNMHQQAIAANDSLGRWLGTQHTHIHTHIHTQ